MGGAALLEVERGQLERTAQRGAVRAQVRRDLPQDARSVVGRGARRRACCEENRCGDQSQAGHVSQEDSLAPAPGIHAAQGEPALAHAVGKHRQGAVEEGPRCVDGSSEGAKARRQLLDVDDLLQALNNRTVSRSPSEPTCADLDVHVSNYVIPTFPLSLQLVTEVDQWTEIRLPLVWAFFSH